MVWSSTAPLAGESPPQVDKNDWIWFSLKKVRWAPLVGIHSSLEVFKSQKPLRGYILRSLTMSHICYNFSAKQRAETCPLVCPEEKRAPVLFSHSERPASQKQMRIATHSFHFPSGEQDLQKYFMPSTF